MQILEAFLQDVRHGLHMLRKSAGFTVIAILTLALGIGANTAIISVVEGVVLSPLPYQAPDRLVVVETILKDKRVVSPSYPDFLDWQRNTHTLQQMAALTEQGVDLTSPGPPEHVNGKEISSGFLGTLAVNLVLGREFSADEDRHGATPVVIISNRLWKNRFGRSPETVGKSVVLNGVDYTIVGVLPSGFRFWSDADVYVPLGQGDPLDLNDRTVHPGIFTIARLAPGVTIGQAQSEMRSIQESLDQLYPAADRGIGIDVVPLKQEILGSASETLLMLLGAVAIVLLIACANVASLLLARSAARVREFAIRSALGANRGRIVRQLMTESLLLSLAGGILGLALAKWGVLLVLATVPKSLPRLDDIHVDVFVLLFAFGVSIAVGIVFGLAPALKSSNLDLQASLKEGGRGSTSVHHRAQSGLVIVQIALTLVLLTGAGLLFRTIRQLWHVDPGFDAHNLITFKVGLSPSVTKTGATIRTAYQQLLDRIGQIPGIQAADLATLVPLSGQENDVPFWVGSQKPASMAEAPRVLANATGPNYLRAMGIQLLRGRFISQEDTIRTAQVAVIDALLARAYFPGKDPVGQNINFGQYGAYRIIGVVDHVQHWELGNPSRRHVQYQAYAAFYQISDQQMHAIDTWTTVVVRTQLDTSTVMPAIKAAVYGADSDQPIYDVQTMQEILSHSMSSQRFPMILLGGFSILAFVLATVGIYGVISYSVSQRVHEIGIRMALGAQKGNVFRMVIGQGLRLAALGLVIGAAFALILTRLLSSFSRLLFGVGTSDPITFAAASFLLTGVAVLACYVPARRATQVDPNVALRYE